MTDEILRAWERTLLILAESNPNAAAVYGDATPAVGPGPSLTLVYELGPAATPLARYNAETARRDMLALTLRSAFTLALEEIGFAQSDEIAEIPIRVHVEHADAQPEEVEEAPEAEPPPHDEAPAPEALEAAQQAAAVAYTVTKIVGAILIRHAEKKPEELLELAKELEHYGPPGTKRSDTSSGYPPEAELRIALFIARTVP